MDVQPEAADLRRGGQVRKGGVVELAGRWVESGLLGRRVKGR